MAIFKEFRDFAVKGNVVDLAVGIIIGAAFGKIVASFVADVLMPPISLLLGKLNYRDLFVVLSVPEGAPKPPYATLDLAQKAGAITLNYGIFFSTVLDFTIVAFAIFLMVKQVNRLKREDAAK